MASKRASEATIYDVAARAGVAPSTVSRAFNRPGRVSSATAKRILDAARQLGYKSGGPAPTPARRATDNIGVVVADLANPFFLELISGAEHAARAQNMHVLTANIAERDTRARHAVESLIDHVDGLLLASTRLPHSEIQQIARRLPTVVANRPVPGVPAVLIDNYEGAMKAAEHLAAQGARSITYLAGPDNSWADATRWRGLLDAAGAAEPRGAVDAFTRAAALRRANYSLRMQQLRVAQPTLLGGMRGFEEWRHHPTDAVVCFNDLVAIGFMQQAHAQGVDIPGDVAVVGFDNTVMTTVAKPSLTTVAGPLRTVGRVAAANLIAMIARMRSPVLAAPRVLPTRLIVRESSLRDAA